MKINNASFLTKSCSITKPCDLPLPSTTTNKLMFLSSYSVPLLKQKPFLQWFLVFPHFINDGCSHDNIKNFLLIYFDFLNI